MVNKLVPFVPSPLDVVERMLNLAELDEGEKVYDLGCGDGRVLTTAARKFRASAVGCELRPRLVAHVRNKVRALRLDDRITIVRRDMFSMPLHDADVVTLYLTKDLLGRLRPKLERELKPSARVVCHDYPIPGWRPEHVERLNKHTIYLYKPVRRI
ncbi:MAG: class I SAM-dependent methyltransferase [Candidatus Caldarchaeum sp.]